MGAPGRTCCPRGMLCSCPCSPPRSPRRLATAGVCRARSGKPPPFAPPPTGDLPPQAFGLRRPRALPSSFRLVIAERASLEVPGFGAPSLPPALASKPPRLPWVIAVDHGLSASGQRWRSGLRRRWLSGRRAKCESRPSPPIQRQAKGRTLSPWSGDSLGTLRWFTHASMRKAPPRFVPLGSPPGIGRGQ